MNHIDEHTLELYALKAEEISGRANEIEEHLRECHGCRALVEEMVQYYDELKLEMQKLPEAELSTEKAIMHRQIHLKPYYEHFAPPVHYRPNTPLAKMFYFVRRHPVAVTMSSFAMVAAIGWILNDFIKSGSKDHVITDKNPSYYLYNTNQNFLEVYNKNDEKLWQIASPNLLGKDTFDKKVKSKSTVISDLDNDSVNEVITTLALRDEQDGSARYLRIFNSNKETRFEKNFRAQFTYLNRIYSPFFNPDGILIDDFTHKDRKEIFLNVVNAGRSPAFIARLNNNGNEIGRYWHFGYMMSMFPLDVNNDGKQEIVLCGRNDTPDTTNEEFAVVAIIDPTKIVGDQKSTTCPGFGWEYSNAELFYIRFPYADINHMLLLNPVILNIDEQGNDEIQFIFDIGGKYLGQGYGFDFYFSKDLKIKRVKSNNKTIRLHADLVKEGKLTGAIDQAYLDKLKNGIRYWDGKEWRKEWAMVKHSVVDGHQTVVLRKQHSPI